jgi:hypothetical protein
MVGLESILFEEHPVRVNNKIAAMAMFLHNILILLAHKGHTPCLPEGRRAIPYKRGVFRFNKKFSRWD